MRRAGLRQRNSKGRPSVSIMDQLMANSQAALYYISSTTTMFINGSFVMQAPVESGFVILQNRQRSDSPPETLWLVTLIVICRIIEWAAVSMGRICAGEGGPLTWLCAVVL
ncbi:hypothetical protein J6590_065085 [Homalodisca vitripennis]|nr:hypothetical protein J6590_065085 [Homalodisca vitripennis]